MAVLRLLGILLALMLAGGAQYLFDHPDLGRALLTRLTIDHSVETVAAGVLLLGMIVFAVAAPAPVHEARPAMRSPYLSQGSLALVLFAWAFYFMTIGLYALGGETGLVRLGWVAGLGLLVVSQLRLDEEGSPTKRIMGDWRSLGPLALVLTVALVLRLFHLATLPQDLHGDMASHGLQARAILEGVSGGIIGVGWADIPLVGFLPTVITMWLTGDRGLLGLNLASVIGGVLSIGGLYVLLIQVASRRVALIAAALLAVSYTHIHFSRIAEYMDPLPWAIWSLAALVTGLRSGRTLPFVLSGILLALSCLMYYAGRVMVVVVVLFLLYLLLARPRLLGQNRLGLLLLAMGFVMTVGPLLLYFALNLDQLLSRSQAVFLFNPAVLTHLELKYEVQGWQAVLGEQIRRSLLMFQASTDTSTQFGLLRPMVNSLLAPLIALGAGYAIVRPRRPACFLLALYLACVLVIGGILTNNAPFWPRLVMILLPATALAALAVDRVWAGVRALFGCHLDQVMRTLVVGGLIYVGLQNWLIYYPFAAHNGRPRAIAGRVVDSLPAESAVCLVPESEEDRYAWIHSVAEREIAFFLPPRQGFDVTVDQLQRTVLAGRTGLPAACSRSGTVWLIPRSRQYILSRLRSLYPGGTLESHGPRRGEVVLFSYRVP